MTRYQRRLAVAALLLAPLLITGSELARLHVDGAYLENETDPVADAASHVAAVAQNLGLWHLAGLLALAFTVAWGLALLAMATVLSVRRPLLGAVGTVAAVVAIIGLALHLGFYYLPLADLGKDDPSAAARAGALLDGSDLLSVVAFLVFLLGTLLAPVLLGVGLWRAGVLPWWAAAGVLAWIVAAAVGMEGELAALANLLLLAPAVPLARHLSTERAAVGASAPLSV